MKFRQLDDRTGNLLQSQRDVMSGELFTESLFGHMNGDDIASQSAKR